MSCTYKVSSVACMHACIMKFHTFYLHSQGKIHNGYVHMHDCMYIYLRVVQSVEKKKNNSILVPHSKIKALYHTIHEKYFYMFKIFISLQTYCVDVCAYVNSSILDNPKIVFCI